MTEHRSDFVLTTTVDTISSHLDNLVSSLTDLSVRERATILPRLERLEADLAALTADVRRQAQRAEPALIR